MKCEIEIATSATGEDAALCAATADYFCEDCGDVCFTCVREFCAPRGHVYHLLPVQIRYGVELCNLAN